MFDEIWDWWHGKRHEHSVFWAPGAVLTKTHQKKTPKNVFSTDKKYLAKNGKNGLFFEKKIQNG